MQAIVRFRHQEPGQTVQKLVTVECATAVEEYDSVILRDADNKAVGRFKLDQIDCWWIEKTENS